MIKMPIETTKPLKKCAFCSKEYANLGLHIINAHPSIMDKLEETTPQPEVLTTYTTPKTPNTEYNDIDTMIRNKLNTMMNIKIIEMLANPNKDVSLIELKNAVTPPQTLNFEELKKYHDLFYKSEEVATNKGNQWLELINGALPIVAQMLPKKIEEVKKNDTEYRPIEERGIGIRRLISQEVASDRGKSGDLSGKSSVINGSEQQISISSPTTNTGA
jgi:hypothetical protein